MLEGALCGERFRFQNREAGRGQLHLRFSDHGLHGGHVGAIGREQEQVAVRFWREQRRQEATERYFAELFKKYEIVADEGVEAVIGPLSVEAGQAR